MIIDEITIHNFGVYLGRQTISLSTESLDKPIILIGGLNGSGKTTLLDAFQLGLFGKLANCSNRGSLAYDKYLQDSIHKSVDPKEGAAVIINFRHSTNGIEHKYQINRSWAISRKNISETVEVLCDGEFDSFLTEGWQEHCEQFIPLNISSLFLFDGEKIKDLAEFGKSSALIATGINQLLGLDLLSQLTTDLIALEKRVKLRIPDKQRLTKIQSIENSYRELKKKKDEIEWQIRESERANQILRDQIKEVDEKFRVEGGELYLKRQELEEKRERASQELLNINNELLEICNSEIPLVIISDHLESILSQSKLESVADDNQRVYKILSDRDNHILNLLVGKVSAIVLGEIKDTLKSDLKKRAEYDLVDKYLNITGETGNIIQRLLNEQLKDIIPKAKELLLRKLNIIAEIESIERQLANVPDADAIVKIIEGKEKLKIKKEGADVNHKVLIKELQNIVKSMQLAEKDLQKELEEEIDLEYQNDSAMRIIKHSGKARQTLKLFQEQVVNFHLKRIEHLVFSSFRQLLRKETLVSSLRIDLKTFEPIIIGSDDRKIDVQRLSAGERQLLAVSLLWGLAKASGRPLPTIIDTPLGRLDKTHRTHLVKRYFPYASHQVLLLSTDEEINEKYYRMIKPWVSNEYHMEFQESIQSTTIKEGYFWNTWK
jgi:DNA sulfur modification protein DndD